MKTREEECYQSSLSQRHRPGRTAARAAHLNVCVCFYTDFTVAFIKNSKTKHLSRSITAAVAGSG